MKSQNEIVIDIDGKPYVLLAVEGGDLKPPATIEQHFNGGFSITDIFKAAELDFKIFYDEVVIAILNEIYNQSLPTYTGTKPLHKLGSITHTAYSTYKNTKHTRVYQFWKVAAAISDEKPKRGEENIGTSIKLSTNRLVSDNRTQDPS